MNIEDMRIVANPTLVREHALDKLRSAIATGLYQPGTRLVERELCEALGVSRTSVREALRQLQSESLIEAGPRRTIIVSVLNAQDAFDIYSLREMVETTAIRRLVERDDSKAAKRLQSAFKAIEKCAHKGDLPALSAMAGTFYEEILDGSGSKVVRDTGRQLLKRVSYLRLASMSEPQRMENGLAEWSQIMDAVMKRDADKAVEALGRHIRNSRDAVVRKLRAAEEVPA
ncbi:GntR family transcriptional regulator [Sphingobium yanoikuyae]|uniref:GntR family transcriptional regulator n=1 Tax=Sphingobium yanoikuyae TaxID=13690 RepID=A0A6M4GCR0_SPHYA|nr:GntR family transcriptional regulator [Sphingobium yanoikuyae]QJR05059.1 GntR family transcriptional regulator [Sphingobium yanoikuyae]